MIPSGDCGVRGKFHYDRRIAGPSASGMRRPISIEMVPFKLLASFSASLTDLKEFKLHTVYTA